ncbi:chitin disaccharide deacetylase [Citrobacter rodentium]|uniref:Chitooligosaccharide deacetylase n=2 Tax=Citrobacter rodentium TaxID=67825 RepID=D2TPF9_CITRI|nr:chitin disaccharide deacetylase [Citrobacter rodentium]KIQ52292.1 hypothetical protein TA05_05615 [Citrobacter rodentium]QBY27395.1 chitin disaccharide deacetylase [Citrobacter rodentium]UHO30692.1 chitin disaccharide deacetylase [Citrobacter rodentium NBRC 105723 = DSM 16636]CBG87528.1 putative chb operon protein ChbG [Citrobacter rodentium ICC168]HAT8013375.1 chitooligosaccharide deacetylase [Citrobacter rodentium NBRC 105723 = DSM 16636]
MARLLIVNADDFGLSKGINYGIAEAHRRGLVTSTTAMINASAIEHAAEISANLPSLAVGLHFVLSYGAPLTQAPSLTREGKMGKWLWQATGQGLVSDEEIVAELHQQYQRFISVFGRPPGHIDSHHHVHFLPQVWRHVEQFAKDKDLPLRIDWQVAREQNITPRGVSSVEYFINDFYGENVSSRFLLAALAKSAAGGYQSTELMCHPGFIDNEVRQSRYCFPRLEELEVLTSSGLKQAVEEQGFRLGTWSDL